MVWSYINFNKIKSYLMDHWALMVGAAAAISGGMALLKNMYHIRNLKLQNRKLIADDDVESVSTKRDAIVPRYEKALLGLDIKYSDVARNSLALLSLTENQFLDLLSIEFKSHPLFSLIDYESLPLPLKGGYFSVLTKTGQTIILETITKSAVKKELFEAWAGMARLYFESYRLPFRTDHNVLINEREFKRTQALLNRLITSAQKYILQTKVADDQNVRMACHELKQRAAEASWKAELLYSLYISAGDSSLLGQVAVQFDLIVSAMHKILVEYNVPK